MDGILELTGIIAVKMGHTYVKLDKVLNKFFFNVSKTWNNMNEIGYVESGMIIR